MVTDKDPTLFDAYYFEHCCGTPYGNKGWLVKYNRIAEAILRDIQPQTMLDAGCAYGYMIESMRQRGVDCWGIDISEHAIQSVNPDVQSFCRVASVLDPLPQRYDLITCFEVVEHMPPGQGELAIANLCRYTDDILFCSSPVDYKEATHLNVQPVEYWAEQFAVHGFFRDVDFDGSAIVAWATRYRRTAEPFHRVARRYERRFWQLLKENYDARQALVDLQNKLSQTTLAHNNLQKETQDARQTRVELQNKLNQMTLANKNLQEELAKIQAGLKSQSLSQTKSQPNRKQMVLDNLHRVRLLLFPPASRREDWYMKLTGRRRS
jgi:SAM-dependent methyltransferase